MPFTALHSTVIKPILWVSSGRLMTRGVHQFCTHDPWFPNRIKPGKTRVGDLQQQAEDSSWGEGLAPTWIQSTFLINFDLHINSSEILSLYKHSLRQGKLQDIFNCEMKSRIKVDWTQVAARNCKVQTWQLVSVFFSFWFFSIHIVLCHQHKGHNARLGNHTDQVLIWLHV